MGFPAVEEEVVVVEEAVAGHATAGLMNVRS
jgi:hypothetical protein